jgi:hypothetical protein
MPREVTDEEYTFLQGRRQVADFVESIYNDPQLNREAKALIKKKYPNLQIPDYDLESKMDRRFDEEQQKRETVEKKKREDDEDAKWRSDRERTQKQYGFTDEAMTRLEKMMVEKRIGDYDVAASYMASKEPPSASEPFDNSRWDHGKQQGFAEIAKDPEGWGRGEILKAIHADQQTQRGQR